MTKTKKEIEAQAKRDRLAAKTLTEIDNAKDMVAFIWYFRQKEAKNWIIMILTAVIVALLGKYTTTFEAVGKWIMSLFGGK